MDKEYSDLSDFRGRILERLDFSPVQLWAFIGVLLVFALGLASLYWQDSRRPTVVEKRVAPSHRRPPRRPAQPLPKLIVHVAGAVNHPGVYHLQKGSRVIDAVAAAGGAVGSANLDALNLAARVADGMRVAVPTRAQAVSQDAPPTDAASIGGKVSLNSATVDQLDQLDGIGPVLAKRIVEYRQGRGGFTRLEQLESVEGIGPKKLALIKGQVTLD